MPKESRSRASLIRYPVKTLRRFFGLIFVAALDRSSAGCPTWDRLATRKAFHSKSSPGHRVSRFLVLDVGSPPILSANVGNSEDHLRPSAASGGARPFFGGLSNSPVPPPDRNRRTRRGLPTRQQVLVSHEYDQGRALKTVPGYNTTKTAPCGSLTNRNQPFRSKRNFIRLAGLP